MNKLIRRILSRPRNRWIIAILLFVLISIAVYTIDGIIDSVQQMVSASEEEAQPYFPKYPAVNHAGKDPQLIKKGEYLTKAGDCMACHTDAPKKGIPFAGGLAMPTPFGTIFTPNITPDKQTGIGNWTEANFIKAMKRGISPSGHFYYPAFPYIYFANVDEGDLKAMWAYLQSLPPVHQENLKNQMVFPFNQRLLQFPWRLLFFHPAQTFVAQPQESAQWKRGAYIVEGLGHCAMCHSPSYHILSENLSLGAPIRKYEFTGSKISGYLAPNISKSNLNNVSEKEIVEVFTKDRLIGGGNVEGPMLEVNHDSLSQLSESDLLAIATYLKSVVSATPSKASGKGAAKSIYGEYCSGCHTSGAGGAPRFGDASSWTPIIKKGMDSVYNNAIHGVGGMPAKGTCLTCSDADIKQTVDYMVAAVAGKTAEKVELPTKKLTMEDGKRIYNANCSSCHTQGTNNAPKLSDKAAWRNAISDGFLETYEDVVSGSKGHPKNGSCTQCNDAELKAAVKYMMQSVDPNKDYTLW